MNDKERMLIRKFLNLELSVQKDIYIQDKMANGLVEAPRAHRTSFTGVSPLVNNDLRSDTGSSRVSARNTASLERTNSAMSSDAGLGGPAAKPKRRASLKILSKQLSQSFSESIKSDTHKPVTSVKSYAVTIVNSNSGMASKAQQKLAFNDLAAPVFTDEDTIDSDHSLSGTSITNTIEGTRPGLSLIREERASQMRDTDIAANAMLPHQDSSSDMEQELLRIGTSKKKKSTCGGCQVS